MNTLFWKYVHNKKPATYDELVEMMKGNIIKEK